MFARSTPRYHLQAPGIARFRALRASARPHSPAAQRRLGAVLPLGSACLAAGETRPGKPRQQVRRHLARLHLKGLAVGVVPGPASVVASGHRHVGVAELAGDVAELDAAGEQPRGVAVAEVLRPPLLADPGGAADAPEVTVAVVCRLEAGYDKPGGRLSGPHPQLAQVEPQAPRERHAPLAAGLREPDRAAAGAGGADHEGAVRIVRVGAPFHAADYDVIIIGAGGGGPVAAKELAEQGLRILHLEAGPHHSDLEHTWTHSESEAANVISGRFRWGPSDRSRPPWVRRVVGPGLITQVAGVGGTTLHYYANSPRAYPLAVERGEWPMSYDELIPYYERVETLLPAIRDPRLPTKDAWLLYGASRSGLPELRGRDVTSDGWRPQYNAVLPPGIRGKGTGCNQCGHCWEGCMHPHETPLVLKAKRATNVSYVPLALQHAGYQLVPDAFVTRILSRAEGGGLVADGVEWRGVLDGAAYAATAEVVVLAGGCIESPRLWLNSGLPNTSDAVGRYLTIHWYDFVVGTFDHAIHPHVGQNSQSRIEFRASAASRPRATGPASPCSATTPSASRGARTTTARASRGTRAATSSARISTTRWRPSTAPSRCSC